MPYPEMEDVEKIQVNFQPLFKIIMDMAQKMPATPTRLQALI
jgi:hypothetical protein